MLKGNWMESKEKKKSGRREEGIYKVVDMKGWDIEA